MLPKRRWVLTSRIYRCTFRFFSLSTVPSCKFQFTMRAWSNWNITLKLAIWVKTSKHVDRILQWFKHWLCRFVQYSSCSWPRQHPCSCSIICHQSRCNILVHTACFLHPFKWLSKRKGCSIYVARPGHIRCIRNIFDMFFITNSPPMTNARNRMAMNS